MRACVGSYDRGNHHALADVPRCGARMADDKRAMQLTSFRPQVQHRPSASPMMLWHAAGPAAIHFTFTPCTGRCVAVSY